MNLNSLVETIKTYLKDNNAEILMGMGIVTGITATGLAIYSTPEALTLIEERKKKTGKKQLTKWETFKVAGRCYIPTALATGASVSMLIGSGYISGKKTAAMATLYKMSESASKLYREKVIETIGQKKEEQVRDEVSKEELKRATITGNNIVVVGSGDVMCFDEMSRQVFKSDIETIKKAQNDFNRKMLAEMYLNVNEWYDMLNLEHVIFGNDIGWNTNTGFLDIYFTSDLKDGIPYLVLDMGANPPMIDYKKY